MTEKLLQRKVMTEAKKRGIFAAKMEAVGQRGFPDLLLLKNGRYVLMELKHPDGTGRLSELQKHMIDVLRGHQAEVHIVHDLSVAIDILESML
jgi:hypothetical protein